MTFVIRAKVSTENFEVIGQNTDINGTTPTLTIIDDSKDDIELLSGTFGVIKHIIFTGNGTVTINAVDTIAGTTNDRIILSKDATITLCFAPETEEGANRWFALDGSTSGITLS